MPYDDSNVRKDAHWILCSGAEVEILENQHPEADHEYVVAISSLSTPPTTANTTGGVRTAIWGGKKADIAYQIAQALLQLRKAQGDRVDHQATADRGMAPPSTRWQHS